MQDRSFRGGLRDDRAPSAARRLANQSRSSVQTGYYESRACAIQTAPDFDNILWSAETATAKRTTIITSDSE
jgi:hypothetical protein